MRVTVANFKGGVGKTTTAIHLAAFLSREGQTLLLDGDPNRSASAWARKGQLPFTVADIDQAKQQGINPASFAHVLIDTQARPNEKDLRALASRCDLLIVPTQPRALDLDALRQTVQMLRGVEGHNFKVLITMAPPWPSRDGARARTSLQKANVPVFETAIRRFTAYDRAVIQGVPVYASDERKAMDAWEDYEKVGREVLNG
jgi:chromosome partitioning protein